MVNWRTLEIWNEFGSAMDIGNKQW